jgi:hypothetical protein
MFAVFAKSPDRDLTKQAEQAGVADVGRGRAPVRQPSRLHFVPRHGTRGQHGSKNANSNPPSLPSRNTAVGLIAKPVVGVSAILTLLAPRRGLPNQGWGEKKI